jgi:hypothetical protein
MFSRIPFLFVMILMVVGVSMVFADTTATEAQGPWYVQILVAAIPALVVYITSQIRSHAKDGTIKELALVAQKVKPYEPIAEEVLSALEAKYPVLKTNVTKVETVIQTPIGQAVKNAAQQVVENLQPTPGQV